MPWRAGVPVVVTVHDATFFSHPQLHSPLKARFFRAAIRRAVAHAAAVVVPSQATADEVARFTGARADAFHVAYHGVDTTMFHPVDDAERARVRATLGVEGVRRVPRHARAPQERPRPRAGLGHGRDGPPAAAGARAGRRPGWDTQVDDALAEVPAHLDARRVGYLPFDDLPGFLSGAAVVAYPSLGEGFGLPVLEAMACGAAVLTSRELSLPEVGGDAVAYTGTGQDEIAAALADLLDDPATRQRLSEAGRARAATFTWDAAARVHLAALQAASRA
ncbi:glycosyltransferase [Cellulomonas soli]